MNNPNYRVVCLALFLLLQGVVLSEAKGPSGYHVTKKVVLGGDTGWDYLTVDAKARRVYISHGTHVVVVDADSGAVVGDIPNTNGVHGIAIASELDKGFTSNGRDNTVTIFDLKTLKALISYRRDVLRGLAFGGFDHSADTDGFERV